MKRYIIDVTPCRRIPGYVAIIMSGLGIVQVIFGPDWTAAKQAADAWVGEES